MSGQTAVRACGVGLFLAVMALGGGAAAFGEESKPRAGCFPVSQRTGKNGCWIMAEHSLGVLPQSAVFWHLSTYSNLAAAEAAKGPRDTVVESLDKVWLFTIGEAGQRSAGGTSVADIGPIPISAGVSYSAQYMEAIFRPGAETLPHTHPGPEVWYHETGGVCLETPQGKGEGHAGDRGYIVPGGTPMRLTVVGHEERRSIVMILVETGKPWTNVGKEPWVPKGLCR